jgi:hypothetical protein
MPVRQFGRLRLLFPYATLYHCQRMQLKVAAALSTLYCQSLRPIRVLLHVELTIPKLTTPLANCTCIHCDKHSTHAIGQLLDSFRSLRHLTTIRHDRAKHKEIPYSDVTIARPRYVCSAPKMPSRVHKFPKLSRSYWTPDYNASLSVDF